MIAVKSRFMLRVAIVLGVLALAIAADRTLFILHAAHTKGSVVDLSSENGRCNCPGKGCDYDCTRFRAQVRFGAPTSSGYLWVEAGTSRGYNSALAQAQFRLGDEIPVVFNPRDPDEAYRDLSREIWYPPLIAFFFAAVALIAAFSPPRRPL